MDPKTFDAIKFLLFINLVRYLLDDIPPPENSALEIEYGVDFMRGRDPQSKEFMCVGAVLTYLIGEDTDISRSTSDKNPEIIKQYLSRVSQSLQFCDYFSFAADLYSKENKPLCRKRLEEIGMYVEHSQGKSRLLETISMQDASPPSNNAPSGSGCMLPLVALLSVISAMMILVVFLVF